MTEAPKPSKVDAIKEAQKAWKAGVAALAKYKIIDAAGKTTMAAQYDDKFKELIAAEKAKEKKK
ncbi:MAG: hypothetical protein HXY34_12780 [Candidatus Thorarchaeota archaeon]|nr:hypothetical protein [Candidatus Thorarchaeota archaeon]